MKALIGIPNGEILMLMLDHKFLSEKMTEVLKEINISSESIYYLVNCLIQTSLRGIDSHGINLFPHYYRVANTGRINKSPNIRVIKTGQSTAIIDGDHAYGHHAGAVGMMTAIELSRETGIGATVVKNSSHFAAASYYGLMAAKNDMIGFAFTNANALVKAYGSSETYFGTNPICFTAPIMDEEPLCLDMATSLTNRNKIKNYERENKSIPSNWAYDDKGKATTDPSKVAMLSPIGEYKGFGLGMMVDVLCSLLAGGLFSKHIQEMYENLNNKRYISHCFIAIRIENFVALNKFKSNLKKMVSEVRNLPTLDGIEHVMVPGDPEKYKMLERTKYGIPIDEQKFIEFLQISSDFKKVVK